MRECFLAIDLLRKKYTITIERQESILALEKLLKVKSIGNTNRRAMITITPSHPTAVFNPCNTEMIESEYKYDPRVIWIEDRYWVTWCNGYHGPTIGIAYTFDFKESLSLHNGVHPNISYPGYS